MNRLKRKFDLSDTEKKKRQKIKILQSLILLCGFMFFPQLLGEQMDEKDVKCT